MLFDLAANLQAFFRRSRIASQFFASVWSWEEDFLEFRDWLVIPSLLVALMGTRQRMTKPIFAVRAKTI
jgi:hypothetical protein